MQEEKLSQEIYEIVYRHYIRVGDKELCVEDPLIIRKYVSPYFKSRNDLTPCHVKAMVRELEDCLHCDDLECRHWYKDENDRIHKECEDW